MKKNLAYSDLYELRRDGMQKPDCWRSKNNGCLPHFHSSIELMYVESGEITAILDGQAYRVKEGQMLLSSSYSMHAFRTEAGENNTVVIMIIPLSCVPSLQKTLNKKAFRSVVYDAREDRELMTLFPMFPEKWRQYGNEICKGFSCLV